LYVRTHFAQEIEKLLRQEIEFIDVRELNRRIKEEKFIIIDVRSFDKYTDFHLPNAVSLPYKQKASEYILLSKIEKDKKIVFYCESGTCGEARAAANQFSGMGYYYVYILKEGVQEWKNLKNQY